MPLLAKMSVESIKKIGTRKWEDCEQDDPGAQPNGKGYRRLAPKQYCEEVSLGAVYSEDPDDPNYSWSQYTPAGKLELQITNPEAWGYIDPNHEYHIEIRRART